MIELWLKLWILPWIALADSLAASSNSWTGDDPYSVRDDRGQGYRDGRPR